MDLFAIAVLTFGVISVGIIAIVLFRPPPFRGVLGSVKGVEVGLTGIKLELAVNAAAEAIEAKEPTPPDRKALTDELAQVDATTRVLWVDDNPDWVEKEIRSLRELGVEVSVAISNDEAVRLAQSSTFDLIVSDIGRGLPEDAQAGKLLPGLLSRYCNAIPPLIYYVGELQGAQTEQGFPVTAKPSELFAMLSSRLRVGRAT